MKKKSMLLVSFALTAILVISQVGFAAESDKEDGGMMNMMENENMGKMMEAMNSPKGKTMMESCGNYMETYGDEDQDADVENTSFQNDQIA